jgi:hypothetical protein
MHGDTARAIDLWRQSILLSSEFRLYGDVFACRLALDNAIFEQSVIDFSELRPIGPLPNTDRLLAAAWPPELAGIVSPAANEARSRRWPPTGGVVQLGALGALDDVRTTGTRAGITERLPGAALGARPGA